MLDDKIGKHCTLFECRQKDWMPIICKYCEKTFCVDHYSLDSHNCSQFAKNIKQIYTCPLCNINLDINSSLSIEENFSLHEAMDCKMNYTENVEKVKKCGTCKTKLTSVNEFQCKYCRKFICLKHRMPEQHSCL